MTSVPLSVVLEDRPKILPLDELTVETPSEDRVQSVLQQIVAYLDGLLDVLVLVLSPDHDLAWYLEGREAILDICRTGEDIDTLMSQLLNALESVAETNVLEHLLTEFGEVSDLILEVKKVVLYYKRNLDIAMNFADNERTIAGITQEIEELIKIAVKIRELTLSDHPPYFGKDFAEVCVNLKINDSPTSNKLRTLPTVNPQQAQAYQEYVEVESRINAVIISLDILPAKLDELNNMCQGLYEKMRNEHVDNFETLFHRWEFLQAEMQQIKVDFIDSHWRQAYLQLAEVTKTQVVLAGLRLNDDPSHWKIVSNAMAVIRLRGAASWLPVDDDLDKEFEKLKAIIEREITSPSVSRRVSSGSNPSTPGGLRQFHTGRAALSLFDVLTGGNLIELRLGKRRSMGDYRRRLGEKRVSSEPSNFMQRLSQETVTRRSSHGSNDASGMLSQNLRNSSFSAANPHKNSPRDSVDSIVEETNKTMDYEHHINNSDYDMSYEAIDESFEVEPDQKNAPAVIKTSLDPAVDDDTILAAISDEGVTDSTSVNQEASNAEHKPKDVTILSKTIEKFQISTEEKLDRTKETTLDNSVRAAIVSRESLTTEDEEDTLLEKVSVSHKLVELSRVSSLHSTQPVLMSVEELFAKLLVPHRPLFLPYMSLDYFDQGLPVVKKENERGSMLPKFQQPRKVTMPPQAYYAPGNNYHRGMIV